VTQLRADALEAHLSRTLAPLYAIHGDEPLLAMEAADAVRARARAAGHGERVVLHAERHFDWSELTHAGASLSLFGERRIVELRMPSGKPGPDGAAALTAFCARLPEDTVTLVTLPRLDRTAQSSAWFTAMAASGVVVNVFPVERAELPRWIAARLAQRQQRAAPDALAFIAECVEGNLLAAHQEIQKLALLHPPGELSFDQVREAVLDVARYEVAQLSEAMLGGDRARLARVLDGLAGEGEAPPRVLWVMSEDVRALARLQQGLANGRAASEVLREARVFNEGRQRLLARAAKRCTPASVRNALGRCAEVDRLAKGLGKGDVWDALLQLGLGLA
jgi:DNA polymerase-3 subunit delta